MKFKLIISLAQDAFTDTIVDAARSAGATGATVITSVRGEGLETKKTFLGLTVAGQRDMALFLVEEHRATDILETISAAGEFLKEPGRGVVFQIDIEDAIGLETQVKALKTALEEDEL
ncbi:P-II family nitrogen regulator [Aliiroseovarius sediminis]|uniref:P-II family nitrogen regulator n=1 Tax=Aliiroseovarius sediminis TaxID=2925839 RepID=UPI001F5A4439|nr:P-II family nitrogen regulator [Aliiroseovarius sediminis]MCI2394052.1 P-II family nitrogen regulator [Aliiroseovarius sediminis]